MDSHILAMRTLLADACLGSAVTDVSALAGGAVNTVWLVRRAAGAQLVVKATRAAPPGLFMAEAEGLGVLRTLGGLRTPAVLAAGPSWLILEALSSCPSAPAFWEAAGRAIAGLHGVQGQRFGWQHDGWLGMLAQHNSWCDDGHEFFAVQRVLRYLSEPKADAVLDTESRKAVERLCARLPELVPPMPPVLTHGDLWRGNVVSDLGGLPAFIDPAVCWAWAETDLSMMYCAGGPPVPPRFFDAYQDLRPLEPGWRDRMPLLHLREILSVLAHFGAEPGALADLGRIIRPFRTRERDGRAEHGQWP